MLEQWAEPVLGSWPEEDSDKWGLIRLSAETLPAPGSCSSRGIVVERGLHYGFTFRFDRVEVFADKTSIASLGLFIFAAIFHEGAEDLEVELLHPSTEIKTIRVERQDLRKDSASPVAIRPLWYDYAWIGDDEPTMPNDPRRGSERCPAELPYFYLTNAQDFAPTEQDRAERDILCGFGSLGGAVGFAEMLLDASRPWVTRTELELESWPGSTHGLGVSPGSAWMRIRLTGDPHFPPDIEL